MATRRTVKSMISAIDKTISTLELELQNGEAKEMVLRAQIAALRGAAERDAARDHTRMNKFNAVRTWNSGYWFASKREARRYSELLLMEKAGEIEAIELQPAYRLFTPTPDGSLISTAKYVADFRYRDIPSGETVVEDVKGVRTQVYKLKKRWVEAQYGITITEV